MQAVDAAQDRRRRRGRDSLRGPARAGPGMREMLGVTAAIVGQGLGETVALITDGRFSGATRGLDDRARRARSVRSAVRSRRSATATRSSSTSTSARIDVEISDGELARRLSALESSRRRVTRTGVFAKYASLVWSASEGAVTRPHEARRAASAAGPPADDATVLRVVRGVAGVRAARRSRRSRSGRPCFAARRHVERSARPQRRLALPRTAAADPDRRDRHAAAKTTSRSTTRPAARRTPELAHGCVPAPRDESDRIVQGRRDDRRRLARRRNRCTRRDLREYGQHVGLAGGVLRPRRHARARPRSVDRESANRRSLRRSTTARRRRDRRRLRRGARRWCANSIRHALRS